MNMRGRGDEVLSELEQDPQIGPVGTQINAVSLQSSRFFFLLPWSFSKSDQAGLASHKSSRL